MKAKIAAVALLATFPLTPFLPGQEPVAANPAEAEAQLRQQLRDLDSELNVARAAGLTAIVVNGHELAPQNIRREAIFLVGAKIVEAKVAEFFVEEWKEQAIADGRDPKELEVTEKEVMADLKGQVDEFRQKNPGVEFWEAVRTLTGLNREGYLLQARQAKMFQKIFFPGPPANWPDITKEAIMASAADNGQQFWENIEKSSTDPETGEARALPAFWTQLCRNWVQTQLKKWSDIRYPSDGLPADVVLTVNGREWQTDDAFEVVRPAVFLQDIERAMTEVVVREALKQALQAQDAYMNDEDFRAEFDEYRQQYDSTPFTTEVIATAFKGYPSLEAYRQRWRLMRSYEKMIAAEINDDTLGEHAKRFARFFADGQTNVDMIQFLAKNIKTGGWVPDGFKRARERAEAAFAEIAGGATFDDVLRERGEFYANDETKGRMGSKPLNQLRQAVHENEFTDLLMGYSIGYHLFYDAEPGTVVGPLRGPDGYYIARVNARTPARDAPSIDDPRTRELVKQDYISYRFLQWSNEVLGNTTVE